MLTACGIETSPPPNLVVSFNGMVATVLTACGIETPTKLACLKFCRALLLQQCLPLAVLKLATLRAHNASSLMLQQCLPLAVLKRFLHLLSTLSN